MQSGGNRCYKVTECSAFLSHATYKASIKKVPPIEITTSWPFDWHASSLTLLINILAVGQSSWHELFILFYFMLLYRIAAIGIVFHCKHNSRIHSYIQNLNPIFKILNLNSSNTPQSLFKPFPHNQLATKAQSFPRKSSNTTSPIARHAKDFT